MAVVWGWLWVAEDDERTCAVCIALDGTIHDLDEDFDDHACGRCTPEPLDENDYGLSDAEILDNHGYDQTGVEWFAEQDADYQRSVLGPTKYEAYASGQLTLGDLVDWTTDSQWGSVPRERSAQELGLR